MVYMSYHQHHGLYGGLEYSRWTPASAWGCMMVPSLKSIYVVYSWSPQETFCKQDHDAATFKPSPGSKWERRFFSCHDPIRLKKPRASRSPNSGV